jgi:predicted nucleotidyltransferase component of viral defense system
MIPRAYITEWGRNAPWQFPEQLEQDLIISQALVKIYQDDFLASQLAFRGGTAMYKLFIHPATRYSEDIDLVQMEGGPNREIIRRLRAALSFIGKSGFESSKISFKLIYHYDSEIEPIRRMRLKIEVNSREHFAVTGWRSVPYSVNYEGFNGEALITTYDINELLGTKLRALYQRRKGRDLYDLYKCLTELRVDSQEIIQCFRKYMDYALRDSRDKHIPDSREFLKNLTAKVDDLDFIGDTKALLSPGEYYDPVEAFNLVKTELIEKI